MYLKKSNQPYYLQIREDIADKIRSGFFKPGDKLPSEEFLASQLGVSRMTVNKALCDLAKDGFLTRKPGSGTFVNSVRYESNANGHLGFMDYMKNKGLSCSSKVISQQISYPNIKIAEGLGIQLSDQVYEIKRLRYVNNLPMVLQTAYIVADLCPSLLETDFSKQSLYQKISEMTGLNVSSAIDRIEAMPCPAEMSKLLQVKPNFPLLYITRIACLENQQKIEMTYSWYRSDQYVLEVKYSNL